MSTWNNLANDTTLTTTIEALKANGMNALVVDSPEEAKEKALSLIPQGSEVMTMSSVTLDSIGLSKEINESGKYNAVKPQLMKMDRETQGVEMQRLGAAPTYAVGSVHAVTQNGEVIIASNTGSQLPAYAYGSSHVIWVVGTQKIVANLDDAMKRIYEYILPLESERLAKAYNKPGLKSNPSKLLIIKKEINPTRITLIFVKQSLGF